MFRTTNGKVTPGMVLRIFADVLMVQCSLLIALSLTWVCHILLSEVKPDKPLSQQFWVMIGQYARCRLATNDDLCGCLLPERFLHLRPILSGPL